MSFIQFFGSALQVTPHFHSLVPDGVFVPGERGVRFEALPPPTQGEVEQLLRVVRHRVLRLLEKRGALPAQGPEDALQAYQAHSLQQRLRWTEVDVRPPPRKQPRCALLEGFSLHANTHLHANDRQGLERLCRYRARGALALERLSRAEDGRIAWRMKRPLPDGTTHLLFTGLELLRRVASLVPPPRANLKRFHGVFAPGARRRPFLVPQAGEEEARVSPQAAARKEPMRERRPRVDWAELLRRTFDFDVLACVRCGGRGRVLEYVKEAGGAREILKHLGLPTAAPRILSAKQTRLATNSDAGSLGRWNDGVHTPDRHARSALSGRPTSASTMTKPDKLTEVFKKLHEPAGLESRLQERNETPLIWAVSEGYHDIALTLIEAGADLNAQNTDGNTALLRAACENRAELASVLIKVGAKLDVQNNDGYSALILARRRGNREIVDSLQAAGADPSLVTRLGTTFDNPGDSRKTSLEGRRDAVLEKKIIDAISKCRDGRMAGRELEKYVNLNPEDRFVPTSVLRRAYVRYDGSHNPSAPNYVLLDDDMELGIVSSAVPEIARAVSSLLSRSLEDARNDLEGHLPAAVVRRVQLEIISPYGVAHIWGVTGHRFVLSRRVSPDRSELLATILVGRSKDTVFFFTGRYNNLRHSTIRETVDFDQPDGDDPAHKWFDRFAFPEISRFKPKGYHHIANFVVCKEERGRKLAQFLLDTIVEKYARDHLDKHQRAVEHSQHLLCGKGFWQIGDPPWLPRMEKLGFRLRLGAESFFIEHDWARLPAIFDRKTGEPISNVAYNKFYGLPQRYLSWKPTGDTSEYLLDRVPEVIRLSQDPKAKLQYFQAMFDFV